MSTQSHIDKVNLKPNILPYAHHVGAPKIEPLNLAPFKSSGVEKSNRIFQKKYDEILKMAEELQSSLMINELVYNSKYSFEPIVGETYHLYENIDGSNFLSIIKPNEWNKKHLFSVILNSNMVWEKFFKKS
jgi:hypothetical protein